MENSESGRDLEDSTDTRFFKLFLNSQWSSLRPYDDAAPFIIAYNNSKAAPRKLLSFFPVGCMLIAASSPTCFVSPMNFERVRFFVFGQTEVAAEFAIRPTIPGNLLDSGLSGWWGNERWDGLNSRGRDIDRDKTTIESTLVECLSCRCVRRSRRLGYKTRFCTLIRIKFKKKQLNKYALVVGTGWRSVARTDVVGGLI